MRYNLSISVMIMLLAISPAAAQDDITLELIDTIDISELSDTQAAVFIGTNPNSIAWDGTNLYVAGFEGSGFGATTKIAQLVDFIANSQSLDVQEVDGSSATTPPLRGRPGLDWDADHGLLATHDLGTDSLPNQIQIFQGQPLALVQSSTTGSGIAGPSWDYGFGGAGFARSVILPDATGPVAGIMDYRNQDVTGALGRLGPIGMDPFDLGLSPIYTASNGGFDISGGTSDTVWRDVDFNPDGGIAARVTQDLVIAERDATNTLVGNPIKVPDPETANALVSGNNVAWVYDVTCLSEDLIIWNDRGPGCLGTIEDAVRFSKRNGDDAVYSIEMPNGDPILDWPNGNCIYDYAWDPALQLLFVMEYSSRQVYVLAPVCVEEPEPCPADVNDDGVLDNGDIGAFITLFLASDPAADINGDTFIDNGDISAYITAFLAGCP